MVLHSFVAIRGLLVGREEILKILAAEENWPGLVKFMKEYADSIPSFVSQIKKIPEGPLNERFAYLKSYLEYVSADNDLDEGECFSLMCEELDRHFVHTWRCCSSLSQKKFILGTESSFIEEVYDVNEQVVTLESILPQGFDDHEILEKIRSFGIDVQSYQLQTFILPDDCSYCS